MALALPLLAIGSMFSDTTAQAQDRAEELNVAGRVSRLSLTISTSKTIRMRTRFSRALVANKDIADVLPLTDQSIYILGKKIGSTHVTILDSEDKLLRVLEVEVTYDLTGLRKNLDRSVPDHEIRVQTINGGILLTGTAHDAVTLKRAVDIAERYAPGQVTNSLSVRAPQQVMLEVRFLEANRSAARDLGVRWDVALKRFDALTGIGGLPSNNVPFGVFITRLLSPGGDKANAIIEALEERGLVRRLAEPNLVALSGDTASFLAGGEFPFPVPQGGVSSAVTIEFKKFGVGIAFTPTVLSNGLINLKIEPEVSDIDAALGLRVAGGGDDDDAVTSNGLLVPGLTVRRVNTTVELRDGQSFAIAGLLNTKHRKLQRQLPWLGQLPVLGTLFRSASYEKEESDLVIIVTPRLVQPSAPGTRLATPLDQSLPSNDRDFFLRGKQEIKKLWAKPYGHILDPVYDWQVAVDREGVRHGSYK